MRVVVAAFLVCLGGVGVWAQPGATGPVADLNAEARAFSETDPAASMAAARKAQVAAREVRDRRGEAEALNYIAYAYRNQSVLDVARQHAEESVRLFVAEQDTRGESQGYNTLGLIEADAGNFPAALDYHLKALAIRERTGDKEGLAYSFNNLGNAYRNLGEYEKALSYHQQGLALKVELGMTASEAYSHQNIGLVHFSRGDHAAALDAYRRALAIREQLNDHRAIGVSLNAIGQVEALTNPAAALVTYQRALTLRRETGDQRGEMATELNLGDVHRQMGQLGRARDAFNRALALGRQIDAPLMESNAHKGLAEVEAARGDYRAAYEHHVQHQAARDEMFNRENAERLQRLQVTHEAARQLQQIEQLEQQRALQDAELARVRATRTALAVIAALVAISLALLYARYRLKQQSEARFRAQAAELAEALDGVRTLKGLLPICAWCKKVRDDDGYWTQVEAYVSQHSEAAFTHSICPGCAADTFGDDTAAAATPPRTRPQGG